MVASSDTETGEEVVDKGPCKRLPLEVGSEHAVDGE